MEAYPKGLIRLRGSENYYTWRSQFMLALKSVELLKLLTSREDFLNYGCVYWYEAPSKWGRQVQEKDLYAQNVAKLSVYLLTSIEKSLHKNLMKKASVMDPWQMWDALEYLYASEEDLEEKS